MDPELIAAWLGIGVATVVGAVGWIFAGIANGKAEKANKIAGDALDEAVEANKIAEDANRLSEHANTLIERQALQQSDPAHVEWMSQWDQETNTLTITNTGRDTAHNATLLITGDDVDRLSDGNTDVARGENLAITFPEFNDERRERNITERARIAKLDAAGIVSFSRPWKNTLTIDIRWLYKSGKPGHQIIEHSIR